MFWERQKLNGIRRAVGLVAPSPDALERGRAALARAIAENPYRFADAERGVKSSRAPFCASRPSLRYGGIFAGVAAAFLSGSVAMAQGAMPGQTLYPVKKASESVARAVAPTKALRSKIDAKVAQRRLDEADELIATATASGSSESEKKRALTAYADVIGGAAGIGQGDPEDGVKASSRLTEHQAALADLEESASDEMRDSARNALKDAVDVESSILAARRPDDPVSGELAKKKMRLAEDHLQYATDQFALSDADSDADDTGLFEADARLAEANMMLETGDDDAAYAEAHNALRLSTDGESNLNNAKQDQDR